VHSALRGACQLVVRAGACWASCWLKPKQSARMVVSYRPPAAGSPDKLERLRGLLPGARTPANTWQRPPHRAPMGESTSARRSDSSNWSELILLPKFRRCRGTGRPCQYSAALRSLQSRMHWRQPLRSLCGPAGAEKLQFAQGNSPSIIKRRRGRASGPAPQQDSASSKAARARSTSSKWKGESTD
jgi:hypothetical protein